MNIQRLPGGGRADQVGAAGDITGLDIQPGDLGQQAVDLGDAHARRHVGLDVFVQLGTAEQRDPGQARTAQGPAAFVLGDVCWQGRCGRWRTETATLHLALALLQL